MNKKVPSNPETFKIHNGKLLLFYNDLWEGAPFPRLSQRYRLFYKIYYEHKIVYFAWINDSQNIHTSDDVDDCYPAFERLYGNGAIDKYVHEVETGSVYKKNTDWGASRIYIKYIRRLP